MPPPFNVFKCHFTSQRLIGLVCQVRSVTTGYFHRLSCSQTVNAADDINSINNDMVKVIAIKLFAISPRPNCKYHF